MVDAESHEILPDFVQELIPMDDLPEVGSYVTLRAPDGTLAETYVHDHHYYGTFGGVRQIGPEYGFEALDILAGYMRHRVSKKFDCPIMITGDERAGKSTFSLHLAQRLDPDFKIENICFKIKDFNRAIDDAKPGDVIIEDEAGFDIYAQEWWNEFQMNLVKKLQVIGKKRIIILLNLPHRKDLNTKIRERRVKFWPHIYTQGEEMDRGFVEICRARGNKWEQTIFWEPLMSFHFPEFKGQLWDEYEKIKDEFIAEVSADEYSPDSNQMKVVEQRNKLIYRVVREKLLSQTEIAKTCGMGQPRISEIYNSIKEREGISSA